MRKDKILMIGPFPGSINGMTLANDMLFNGLVDRKINVDKVDTSINVKNKNIEKQGKFNVFKAIFSIYSILVGSYKIIRNKYNCVYITPAQSYIGFLRYIPFIFFSKLKYIPCYIEFHGGYVGVMYENLNNKKKKRIKKYFNMCSGIIVLGESLKGMLKDIVSLDKVYVCENGVEEKFILSEEEFNIKYNNDFNNLKILYLSNIMKTKGILELLEACKKLRDENIDFSVDIAGAVSLDIEKEFNAYLEELKDNVHYHGVVTGDEKRTLLKNCNIFCLPTYYQNEGQPISILEAMCMGNSIVTTYQGGIKDIFKDNINGVRCDINYESIKDSILDAKYNKFALNNYTSAKEKYSKQNFVNRIMKIININ